MLRVWLAGEQQHVSIRVGVWDDPAGRGIMLADLADMSLLPISKVKALIDLELYSESRLAWMQNWLHRPMNLQAEFHPDECFFGRW